MTPENQYVNYITYEDKLGFIHKISSDYGVLNLSRHNGIETGSFLEYLETLDFLCNKKLKGFIEIGSAWGGSFHLWGSIIKGVKISVDLLASMDRGFEPWPNGLTVETFEQRLNIWKTHFSQVHSVVGASYEETTITKVRKLLRGRKVDFLYIDAEHTDAAAEKDFECYKEFVNSGGYVGFHDIQITQQFWEKISQEYWSIEFPAESSAERIGLIQLP